MKILVLSNYYPPFELGGQGRSCKQVVDGLIERGHILSVLTSTHGKMQEVETEPHVSRSLFLEMEMEPLRNSISFFIDRKKRERANLEVLDRQLIDFQPDLVFVWGMWNLHRSIPKMAEQRYPDHVVYRFAEYWPTLPTQYELYWRTPGRHWLNRLPKYVVGRLALAMLRREPGNGALKFRHAFSVSEATKRVLVEAGIPVEKARVIHTGLNLDGYYARRADESEAPAGLKVLYAGRLTAEKGVETAIAAIGRLAGAAPGLQVSLSIAGRGSERYLAKLQELALKSAQPERIKFLGFIEPEDMPALLAAHHALVVPSLWPEPFARSVLEGMATGLAVVATPAGGTQEILRDGENGLLFQPDSPEDLSRQLTRLAEDPALLKRLGKAGRQTILDDFSTVRMMDQIESFLLEVVDSSGPAGKPSLEASG